MSWALVIHDVDDYAAWKVIFDDAAPLRQAAGEREYRVLRSADDGQQVVHLSRWISLEAAREFFESPEVERIRAEAGVHPPQFLYLREAAAGVLGA